MITAYTAAIRLLTACQWMHTNNMMACKEYNISPMPGSPKQWPHLIFCNGKGRVSFLGCEGISIE